MNNEMIIVNGKHFIKSHLEKMTWKQTEKLFKKAIVSDDTVREAWEQVNPEKVRARKAEPESEDSTEEK